MKAVRIGNRWFDPARGPFVVGVLNLSPESPNQDAVVHGAAGAVQRARQLAAAGADILDIGGRSSNYAAPLASVDAELARLVPALQALKAAGFLVAVDTWEPAVVRAASAAGADVINDSDGFQSPEMIAAIAASGLPVIIPFLNGPNPREVQPFDYERPLEFMLPWFEAALARAAAAGVRDVILDPGTGYAQAHLDPVAKEAYQRRVYPELGRIKALGAPLFVALPRKQDPGVTFELAVMLAGVADFLRAHDVALARRAIAAAQAPHPAT